jgi:hypothetical protein
MRSSNLQNEAVQVVPQILKEIYANRVTNYLEEFLVNLKCQRGKNIYGKK